MQAIIFDFDGVIADTMQDNCRAWQKAFAAYGFDMPEHEYFLLEGMGRYQIADHFITQYGLDPAIREEVAEAKEQNYKRDNTFRLYDGVAGIFGLLQTNNVPCAIVTGASRARISEHLSPEMAEQLTALVTADDVTHTKPHPEPYSKAVNKLNIPASDCLVVENAILGVASALAAGCKCVALTTTVTAEDLKDAEKVFTTHAELLNWLTANINTNN